MSGALSAERLLAERGSTRLLDGFVVAACFDRAGRTAAFALGDGDVHLASRDGAHWQACPVHDGACLALCPDAEPRGFLSGGDDGGFRRLGADGAVSDIADLGTKWVERVASHPDPKAPLLACAVGRRVHLHDAAGRLLRELDHPSTVTGLAFDARGKRIGASHYNGASLWFVAAKSDKPRLLDWKGSHTMLAIHPGGEAVVTAMQENALHGWRLSDNQHMRMSGYPAKTEQLSFTRTGKWLASSGADSVVMWPFFGGGPMGKAPTELAPREGVLCTAVSCHPQNEMVAAGFADGVVAVIDIPSARVLPLSPGGHGPVSALFWSPDGGVLGFGTEGGFAALLDLTAS